MVAIIIIVVVVVVVVIIMVAMVKLQKTVFSSNVRYSTTEIMPENHPTLSTMVGSPLKSWLTNPMNIMLVSTIKYHVKCPLVN